MSRLLIRLFLLFTVTCAISPAVYSQDERLPVLLTATAGSSSLSESGYDNAAGWSAGVGMAFKYLVVEIGIVDMDVFELQNVADSHIKVSGLTLSAIKGFDISDRFAIDVRAGLYRWDAEARFLGMNAGEDSGTNPYVGAALKLKMKGHNALFVGAEQYFDVSGADVTRLSLGVTVGF